MKANTNVQSQVPENVQNVQVEETTDMVALEQEQETEVVEQPKKKKSLGKRIKGFCKKHKKMLIIGGVAAAAAGGYAYYKHASRKAVKAAQKAIEVTAENVPFVDKSIPDLKMAEYAANAVSNQWLVDAAEGLKDLDRAGKTIIQNLPDFGAEYLSIPIDVVDSSKEAIHNGVMQNLDKVLDTISVDTIKSVSLLYDIS